MLRILLSTALCFTPASALVVQEHARYFGPVKKQHPTSKLFWLKPNHDKGDPGPDSSVLGMQPAHATESQNKILAQQHSFSIRKKALVRSAEHPGSATQSKALLANEHMNTSVAVQTAHNVDSAVQTAHNIDWASKMLNEQPSLSILSIHMIPQVKAVSRRTSVFQSKALRANQHMKSGARDISSGMLIILVAVIVVLMITLVVLLKTNKDQDYRYRNTSPSSSEVPSSDSASRDRELKDRIERFERRLDEHKEAMLRGLPESARASVESVDTEELVNEIAGSSSRSKFSRYPSWMQETKRTEGP